MLLDIFRLTHINPHLTILKILYNFIAFRIKQREGISSHGNLEGLKPAKFFLKIGS